MTRIGIVDISEHEFWRFPKWFISKLKETFVEVEFVVETDVMKLSKSFKDCQGIICLPVVPNFFKRIPNLQNVFILGSGIPDFLLNYEVYSAKGVNARSVAEHANFLTLAAMRCDVPQVGKMLNALIIGTGNVAKELESLYLPLFNCVTMAGRKQVSERSLFLEISQNYFYQNLSSYDVICIAIASNSQTKKIFDKSFFKSLKKKCILVNISRGDIFEEENLLSFLSYNDNRYYTDVTSPEIYPEDGPLNKFSNFYNTNHIAGTFQTVWHDYFELLVGQIKTSRNVIK